MAMMDPLPVPPLGISEREAEIRFEKLQAKLIPLWRSISGLDPMEQAEQTVVVVPSQSIDFDCKGAEMQCDRVAPVHFQPRLRVLGLRFQVAHDPIDVVTKTKCIEHLRRRLDRANLQIHARLRVSPSGSSKVGETVR